MDYKHQFLLVSQLSVSSRIEEKQSLEDLHFWDKHNTSEICTSISARNRNRFLFFECLCMCLPPPPISLVLCISHKCKPGLSPYSPLHLTFTKCCI